ncbi:MAG TPA: winged helix-turn-helix transcriptional regulator [Solirubrobacterales bacterium]|jgi:DNA-binding HxlR family transcriptional regulator|nr:winged helix-turn-helix transcriptional regulator [Solirubrobacterales bacterium]
MTGGDSGIQLAPSESRGSGADELTTPNVLRLLSSGATGAILMALGNGPLRTKELTGRVRGYSPRTIYRYAGKLAEIGVIEREERPGVPSKVLHRLSDPCGTDLHRLVDDFATASLSRLPNGEVDAHSWGSLGLLADLWESGVIEELNLGPRTATELAQVRHGLSYHQVSRRTSLFTTSGFIRELQDQGRRRRFALTGRSRRAMALIAGIGRWRRRHVVFEGETGLSARETAVLLRTALPLVALPKHAGKGFEIGIFRDENGEHGADATVWAKVGRDGSVRSSANPATSLDAWGHGRVATWVDSLLDGLPSGVQAGGDHRLIEACLRGLHASLWKRHQPDDGRVASERQRHL